jgi:Cu-Zn family superoxide dismutase
MHDRIRIRPWPAVGTLAVVAALSVAAAAQQPRGGPADRRDADATITASASLKDAKGQGVGRAELTATPNGVIVHIPSMSAPPGPHAFHIHETGRCDAPSFESAGGHFNPDDSEHGYENERGPHAGDLPNVHVPESGQVDIEFLVPDVTLDRGPSSLLDADGTALVMHVGRDNYFTEPAGDAGSRYACGVIER